MIPLGIFEYAASSGGGENVHFTYTSGSSDTWIDWPYATYGNVLGAQAGTFYNQFSLGGSGSITPDNFAGYPGLAFAWMIGDEGVYLMLTFDGMTGSENFKIIGGPSFMDGKQTSLATVHSVNGNTGGIIPPVPAFFWYLAPSVDFAWYGEWYGNEATGFNIENLDP